jgi:hypothetical protein
VPGTCARASECDVDVDVDFECYNEGGGWRVSTGSSDDDVVVVLAVVLAIALAKTLESRRKSVYRASIFKITI